MSMKTVFILTTFVVQFRHERGLEHESKRLLVDDPNIMSQTLLALEKIVQSLQVENGGIRTYIKKALLLVKLQELAVALPLQCLPRDPASGSPLTSQSHVEIDGSEYEYGFGTNSANEDIPCAACRTRGRSSTIMIPGRFSCYPGFTMEYRGYLAGGNYEDPSDYICIDEKPEFVMGGEANDDSGRKYYTAKVHCGPLPCPPYHEGNSVACVVCSK